MKNDKPSGKKKPCRVCRTWFAPNPRIGARQKICSSAECKQRWKQRGQAAWSRRNPTYWVERRLDEHAERLESQPAAASAPVGPAPLQKVPLGFIQEKAGPLAAAVLLFSLRLLRTASQDELRRQVVGINRNIAGLLAKPSQVEMNAEPVEDTGNTGGLLPSPPQVEIATVAACP